MDYVNYFEDQIKVQQQAIRSFKLSIVILVLVGLIVILLSIVIDTAKGFAPDLIKIGGGAFTAALATLPYKEISPRRERITLYKFIKESLTIVETLPLEERQRIMQMAIDAMRENMKR